MSTKRSPRKKPVRADKALLTVGDIRELESAIAADVRHRYELDTRISEKRKRLEAAKLFLPQAAERPVQKPKPTRSAHKGVRNAPKSARRINGARLTWASEVSKVLNESKTGISHQDLLAELSKTALGDNVSNGAKGFYNAVARLTKAGEVVKSGGLLYSFKLAQEIRDRGEALPSRVVGRGGSSSIVLGILHDHPHGLSGPQIKEIAGKHPDAPPSIREHGQYIYNVLGSLQRSGLITKHEGKYWLVKPQAAERSGAGA